MKKLILIFILLLTLLLSGCQREAVNEYKDEILKQNELIEQLRLDISKLSEKNLTLQEENEKLNKSKEDLENELIDFKEKEYSIDIDFSNEMNSWDGNTAKGVEISMKYGDMWKEEMDKYYELLYEQFDEDGKEILEVSQNKWKECAVANEELKWKINDNIHHGGSIMSICSAYNYYERYRVREIFLKEEYELLTFTY